MKTLLLVAAATLGIGLFAPQANAHDKHHHDRDGDDHYYRKTTKVYRTYRYYDYGDRDWDRCEPPVHYYRPACYEYRPVYRHHPRWSFFFSF
jgi:hypothetical protein